MMTKNMVINVIVIYLTIFGTKRPEAVERYNGTEGAKAHTIHTSLVEQFTAALLPTIQRTRIVLAHKSVHSHRRPLRERLPQYEPNKPAVEHDATVRESRLLQRYHWAEMEPVMALRCVRARRRPG